MIHIWIWRVPLPGELRFLVGPVGSALGTLAFWILVAFVVQLVVLRLMKALARRTETDVEDVIVGVSRRPLIVLIILLGMVTSLDALELTDRLVEVARRWLVAGIMALVTYWVWRILKEVVIHYGMEIARRTEASLDDVLLPIANQFAPVAVFLVGGAAILQYLGIRLDALLVAIGVAAFILAFALQDILSNVFSGLSLLVDTPFKYGDLVSLEDGKVCQVVKIGMRVTHLYDIGAHALIYVPNSKLANERLINLMQPTPELISTLRIEVGRDHDVERILGMLRDVLDGYPDLLGDIDQKLRRIEAFEVLSPGKRAHGAARLRLEQELDRCLGEVGALLRSLAKEVTSREKKGFTKGELAEVRESFKAVGEAMGLIEGVEKRLASFRGNLDAFVEASVSEIDGGTLAAKTWRWVDEWCLDPDILKGEDDEKLRHHWGSRVLALMRRVDGLRRLLERPDGMEQRLDDAVVRFSRWLTTDFKQPIPGGKMSSVGFKGLGDVGLAFSLFFYVDDIELKHFARQARVEGEIRREVMRRLRLEGIDLPRQAHDVALLSGALLGRSGGAIRIG